MFNLNDFTTHITHKIISISENYRSKRRVNRGNSANGHPIFTVKRGSSSLTPTRTTTTSTNASGTTLSAKSGATTTTTSADDLPTPSKARLPVKHDSRARELALNIFFLHGWKASGQANPITNLENFMIAVRHHVPDVASKIAKQLQKEEKQASGCSLNYYFLCFMDTLAARKASKAAIISCMLQTLRESSTLSPEASQHLSDASQDSSSSSNYPGGRTTSQPGSRVVSQSPNAFAGAGTSASQNDANTATQDSVPLSSQDRVGSLDRTASQDNGSSSTSQNRALGSLQDSTRDRLTSQNTAGALSRASSIRRSNLTSPTPARFSRSQSAVGRDSPVSMASLAQFRDQRPASQMSYASMESTWSVYTQRPVDTVIKSEKAAIKNPAIILKNIGRIFGQTKRSHYSPEHLMLVTAFYIVGFRAQAKPYLEKMISELNREIPKRRATVCCNQQEGIPFDDRTNRMAEELEFCNYLNKLPEGAKPNIELFPRENEDEFVWW